MPNADYRVALPVGERQYHIDLGPGELAEYVLLPGDPDRTARIAARLDSIELERRNREFASVTGLYKGLRVSIVSTGIGPDNIEIVIAEILALTERPTLIRVGSSGSLQPEIKAGDVCITSGAVRLETTTAGSCRMAIRRWPPRGGVALIEARQPPGSSISRRDHGNGARVLRCAGTTDSAPSHPIP